MTVMQIPPLESEPREIHIWEFPQSFCIQVKPTMMKELMNHATEAVGDLKQLARVLMKNHTAVCRYRDGKMLIPLHLLIKCCDLAGDEFSIELIEPHIVAYKGGASVHHPIWDPCLPLVETPDLFALMGHMTGDGGHSASQTYYVNTEHTLIRKFLRHLRVSFGHVHVNEIIIKNKAPKKPLIQIFFGPTIRRLLTHLYHTDFRTSTVKVPSRLFELPPKYAAAYLQALGDDEGNVDDTKITILTTNRTLMRGVIDLIQDKFPLLSKFTVFEELPRPPYATVYGPRFRTGAFKPYRTLIGFTHPGKKEDLNYLLALQEREWGRRTVGATRRKLLDALCSTPMTVKELSRLLEVNTGSARRHLKGTRDQKGLIAMRYVRILGTKPGTKRAELFEITKLGQDFLKLPSIGLLGMGFAGRTKVAILQTLAGRSLTSKELQEQLALKREAIRNQMNGQRTGKETSPGLLALGLVDRIGRGKCATPYVYHLTDEGQQFLAGLKRHIPELWKTV